MNERIKELWKQSQTRKEVETFTEGISTISVTDNYEKFAELIVKECMAMCKTAAGNADYNTGRLHCLEDIKEHFGVEE